MNIFNHIKDQEITDITKSLLQSAESVYQELKTGNSLTTLQTSNTSNDQQIELDVFADQCFVKNIQESTHVKYILSEERADLIKHGNGKYSLALDPLDGSKSAKIGIPCGAIFGVFKNADHISDFNGSHIMMSGFFVFGINLEIYLAIDQKVYKGNWNSDHDNWDFIPLQKLPHAKMIAINTSNKNKWDEWLQDFYDDLVDVEDEKRKSYNMRWYASMVAEIKRLILQGGLFAYPNDSRKGYENGHLRLIYEAIPMAYLIDTLGGRSTDGKKSILGVEVKSLHQKIPVYLGDKHLIQRIEKIRSKSISRE